MSVKTKIVLLTAGWLMLIVLFVDITVYFSYIHSATRNEIDTLRKNEQQLIEKYGAGRLLNPAEPPIAEQEIPDDTIVTILSPSSEVIHEIRNTSPFPYPAPQFRPDEHYELAGEKGERLLVVYMPIVMNGNVKGSMQMTENLVSLETNLDNLVTILASTAAGAMLLCIAGCYLLVRAAMRPVSIMIGTMEEIERSLSLRKMPLPSASKDEIHKMTLTFNRMIDRLEESIAGQKRFVSDASHELGTTVTIIEGYANMLRRWGMKDASILQESVESIHDETKRMKRMTEQLMDLASLEQGTSLDLSAFDLAAECRKAVRLAAGLDTRMIRLEAEPSRIDIHADREKIMQLMLILLDNALKYSQGEVDVRIRAEDGEAVIEVSDRGVGIPPDQLDRIFERFYRVDKARSRDAGGTGLGLSIARTIAAEHCGTIAAASRSGAGTTMTVRLPLGGTERYASETRPPLTDFSD